MPKIRKKSPIHDNADANVTCDFGDGDISRSRSRLPHKWPDGHIVLMETERRIASWAMFADDLVLCVLMT